MSIELYSLKGGLLREDQRRKTEEDKACLEYSTVITCTDIRNLSNGWLRDTRYLPSIWICFDVVDDGGNILIYDNLYLLE